MPKINKSLKSEYVHILQVKNTDDNNIRHQIEVTERIFHNNRSRYICPRCNEFWEEGWSNGLCPHILHVLNNNMTYMSKVHMYACEEEDKT